MTTRLPLDYRTEKLLHVAQALQAAQVLPVDSGRRVVGLAKAVRLAVKGDERGLATVALTELTTIATELEEDAETTGGAVAGYALRRRVDLCVQALA